ncbi:hypothetical protein [Faecalibacter bovis]|uniref:Uncharacterized protein n=1 Tax=Faecalibacter bovis TaxID=2898187 RepID=A0ABX7XDV5_9FLAO|nr:hypothetical protein [Faecalibacter bovis]QTV06067.1 hypothetical protein J9309_01580 [Faecalibacter bovis]
MADVNNNAQQRLADRNTIKQWFKRGLKPLQEHFWTWIDSFWHKNDLIPMSSIQNLTTILDSKSNLGHIHIEYTTPEVVQSMIDNQITSIYRLMSPVATYADLPMDGNLNGDVRNVIDTGMNYVWDGAEWDALGGSLDLTNYVTQTQFTTALSDMATQTWVNQQLANVSVDLSGYYTAEEVDWQIGHAITGLATQAWVNEQIANISGGGQMDLSIYALKDATGLSEEQIDAWRNALRVTDIEVENLYNADGTLTGNRNVNLGGFTLQFLNGYIKANRYSLNIITGNSHPNSIHTDGNKLKFTNNAGVTQELLTEFSSVQDMLVITSNTNISSSMINRNILFDNGTSNLSLIVPSSLPENFIMSGIKLGSGRLTIIGGAGVVINQVTYTDVVYGISGSRFMLSRVGNSNVFNLYTSNYE